MVSSSGLITLMESQRSLVVLFVALTCLAFLCCHGRIDEGAADDDQGSGRNGSEMEMVPAMFVFGDSLIDNGNNNDLPSFAKANYYPYGIDFDAGPTGRFSNGYTIVDEIADLLGLPLIPPFSEASGDDVLHGVNYASAAAGILDITGGNFVGRIPFNQQITHFQNTLDQISRQLGGVDKLAGPISRSLFFVGMGSNDYLNNYMMPNYATKNQYNPDQYSTLLVQQYTRQIMNLYNLGARKFVLAGVGKLGCIPSVLAQNSNSKCSEQVNGLVIPFNKKVRGMVDTLNQNLPGAKFVLIDIYNLFNNILLHPSSYGFSVVDRGCCGIGRNSGQITCLPFQTPCSKREKYVFWDAFHPTDRVNVIIGKEAFNGTQSAVYPINIKQLATTDLSD